MIAHLPHSRTLPLALVLACTATLMLAGCNRDTDDTLTPATTSPVTEPGPLTQADPMHTPTAVNVEAVTLGTSAGADGRVQTPMTTFASSDPIVVSIDTRGAATSAQVTARLIYQDGQTAGEQTETITSTGAETATMIFNNPNGWPAGSYRVEIWVDGTQAHSQEFTVS